MFFYKKVNDFIPEAEVTESYYTLLILHSTHSIKNLFWQAWNQWNYNLDIVTTVKGL